MSSSEPRGRAAGERGFTLLEVMFAFAILMMAFAMIFQVQSRSLTLGAKALDYRNVREMADTVLRRIIYEIQNYNDGDRQTGDIWYGEYVGLTPKERIPWKDFLLVLHKKKGMAAGSDPSGEAASLWGETSSSSGSDSGGTTGGSSSSGSGSADSSGTEAGEQAYQIALDVFVGEEATEPFVTIRTIIPIPAAELENK